MPKENQLANQQPELNCLDNLTNFALQYCSEILLSADGEMIVSGDCFYVFVIKRVHDFNLDSNVQGILQPNGKLKLPLQSRSTIQVTSQYTRSLLEIKRDYNGDGGGIIKVISPINQRHLDDIIQTISMLPDVAIATTSMLPATHEDQEVIQDPSSIIDEVPYIIEGSGAYTLSLDDDFNNIQGRLTDLLEEISTEPCAEVSLSVNGMVVIPVEQLHAVVLGSSGI